MAQYVENVEVITPADEFDLVTVDQVKAFFNITSTEDDLRIEQLIAFASHVIADYCDRVFALEEVIETVTLEGMGLANMGLNLSRWPIVSIASVDGADNTYTIDKAAGILHLCPLGRHVIQYTAGYNLPEEAPGPLQSAAMDMIRQTYYYGSRDPFMQSITDNATGSIRFFPPPGMSRTGASSGKASPLSPQATALLAPYKRVALA